MIKSIYTDFLLLLFIYFFNKRQFRSDEDTLHYNEQPLDNNTLAAIRTYNQQCYNKISETTTINRIKT